MGDLVRAWTPVLLALFAAGVVLVLVGLLGRFLDRGLELEPIDGCTCGDCEDTETWDDEPDWLDDVFRGDLLSPDPFAPLIDNPTWQLCYKADCRACDVHLNRTRTETD